MVKLAVISKITPEKPVATYSEKDILKDSRIWDYLQYLQLNRINFISTEVFNESHKAGNQLLNLVSATDQFEFLVWDKLKNSKDYQDRKPVVFKDMQINPNPQKWLIRRYIEGDNYMQMALKIMAGQWLKEMSPALGSMKTTKRVDFVAGEGMIEPE